MVCTSCNTSYNVLRHSHIYWGGGVKKRGSPDSSSPEVGISEGVMLKPLCNQTVNLDTCTDAKTDLYYSLLKLKYSPSINLKHKKD